MEGREELIEKLSGNCVFSACAGQAGAYQGSVFRIGTGVRYPAHPRRIRSARRSPSCAEEIAEIGRKPLPSKGQGENTERIIEDTAH